MSDLKCPNCQAHVEPDTLFCDECGHRLDTGPSHAPTQGTPLRKSGKPQKPATTKPAMAAVDPGQSDDTGDDHLGLWHFADTDSTVEFNADGSVHFQIRGEPDWSATGRWERLGDGLRFDCADFTFYDVMKSGEIWIGTNHRNQEEDGDIHQKSVLARPGADLSSVDLSLARILRPSACRSYDGDLYDGFVAYITAADRDDDALALDCLTQFSALIASSPNRPEAYIGRAFTQCLLENFGAALDDFDAALDRHFGEDARYESIEFALPNDDDPDDPDEHVFDLQTVLYFKAECCFKTGKMDQAKWLLDANFDWIPDQYEGEKWLLRANLLANEQEYSAAWRALTCCLQTEPDMAAAHNLRGYLHIHSGSQDTAIAAFTEALELDPNLYDARLHRARLYAEQEKWDAYQADLQHLQAQANETPGNHELEEKLADLKQRHKIK